MICEHDIVPITAALFSAPVPFEDAQKQVAGRVILPTTLNTAELREQVDKAFLKRAMFSAQTTDAWYLDQIAGVVQDLVDGKTDVATSRLHLKTALDAIGYTPEPDKEGGIQDLGSDRRLNLILETQLGTAYGYGQLLASQDEDLLQEFPAWQLVRWEGRRMERDWELRWMLAADGTDEEGRNDDELIARKDHEIWQRLGSGELFDDALDTQYPPFAFSSGMGVRELNREEAMLAGVIGMRDEVQPLKEIPDFGADATSDRSEKPAWVTAAILDANPDLMLDADGVLTFAEGDE